MRILKNLLIVFVLLLALLINVNFSSVKAEEKVYSHATVNQSFAQDSVVILMKHEVSMKEKTYYPRDFIEVHPDKVEDNGEYSYKEVLKYLRGEPYNKNINVNNFRRSLVLKWNVEKTKEEIIDIIHILEKRDDIYLVQPNYYYVLDSWELDLEKDKVANDIWQSIYYVNVTNKYDYGYVYNGKNQCIIECEIIKSYDELVQVESNIDKLINNNKEDNKFKFIVNQDMFDEFNIGYEYIVKLNDIIQVECEDNTNLKLPRVYFSDSRFQFIRVVNNRLFIYEYDCSDMKIDGQIKQVLYFNTRTFFYVELSQYIYKKEFVRNEAPIEFEIDFVSDPAGSFINVRISDEELEKLEYKYPLQYYYRFYYFKTGSFLQNGDNVLMFDEYIKLAKEIYDGRDLIEPTEATNIRNQAIENIKNSIK